MLIRMPVNTIINISQSSFFKDVGNCNSIKILAHYIKFILDLIFCAVQTLAWFFGQRINTDYT